MSTLRRVGILFGIVLLAATVWLGIAWINFLKSSTVKEDKGAKYTVHAGASYKTVSSDLYQQRLIKQPFFFNLLFRYRDVVHQLKAGEYLFPKGSTPETMLTQITTGKGMVYHSFSIIPGTTFKQIRKALNNDMELLHTTRDLSDAEIMKQLGYPTLHPEGQFYPDTYYYVVDTPDLVLLKRAFHAMTVKLNRAWQERAPNAYFQTPYQALIAASIIEKEAKVHTELPVMAGVMVNRLKSNMVLQFDPTVIYGVGERYNGTIYKHDLADNNPYNTYIHKGLPPTPISMPGKEAIDAVMHPDQNDYYYFVGRGDHATHQFSKTLDEHYVAVNSAKLLTPMTQGFVNVVLLRKYVTKLFTPTHLIVN